MLNRASTYTGCTIWMLPLLFVLYTSQAEAQNTDAKASPDTYSFIFKGEPIEYALQQLVKKTHMDLIYDPDIIPEHSVFSKVQGASPEGILRQILQDSPLDFIQLSSGTYVLIAAPRKKAMTGHLSGRVIDGQTGQPLAGANVMLADASGGAVTSGNGHFSIPELSSGYHELTITYVGYQAVRDTVWVPANASTSLDFSLAMRPIMVEPIVVDGIRKRLPASAPLSSGLSSAQVQEAQITGTADAVKSLDAISGISFSLPLADFNIQGGASGDHQLRLDGVPIYNPVSMGRMLGAFSPWAIDKITINKAGFGADIGSRLSGVVNLQQDVGNTRNRNLMFQANTLNLNARFDQEFTVGKGGPSVKLMLAGRGNIWRWYQDAALRRNFSNWDQLDPLLTIHLLQDEDPESIYTARDHDYDINYYDLHATVQIDHNPFHQTDISAYYGKNELKSDLFSENTALTSQGAQLFYSADNYDWQNTMVHMEHHWIASPRLDANFSGYLSRHRFNHSYLFTNNRQADISHSLMDNTQDVLKQYAHRSTSTADKNAMIQSALKLNLNYTVAKSYHLAGGLRGTHFDYRFNLSDQYYKSARSDNRSFLIAGFLQNHFMLSPNLNLSAGSRFTFVPSRDLVFAEPRFSFKYDAPDSPIGYYSAKLAGGIYRQFVNQFDVSNVGPSSLVPSLRFWVPVDYTTTVPKAYHLALSGRWEPAESWKVELETYYKWIPSRLMLNYQMLSDFGLYDRMAPYSQQEEFITSSKGYAYGASLSAHKRFTEIGLELRGSYQYSVAKQHYPRSFDHYYQPLPNNQPHKVDATLHWGPVPDLKLLLQWQGIWGRSWGFRKAYYDYLSIRKKSRYGDHTFTNPGGDRLPLFAQLNAGISYRLKLGKADLNIRFDAFNLLDRKNVLNWWLDPQTTNKGDLSYQRQRRVMNGLRPSLSLKLSY